jgi:hypothetical protein
MITRRHRCGGRRGRIMRWRGWGFMAGKGSTTSDSHFYYRKLRGFEGLLIMPSVGLDVCGCLEVRSSC